MAWVQEGSQWIGHGYSHKHAYTLTKGDEALRQRYQNLRDTDEFTVGLYALANFFRRSWFQRAWVLQEYTLYSNIAPEIYCGRSRIPWFILALFLTDGPHISPVKDTSMFQFHKSVFIFEADPGHSSRTRDRNRYPVNLDRLHKLLYAKYIGGYTLLHFFEGTQVGFQGGDSRILPLLKTVYSLKCSDPKDRLYSILGLVHGSPMGSLVSEFKSSDLIIDYAANTEDVLSSIVRAIGTVTNGLEVLRFRKGSRSIGSRTWTPDWEETTADLKFFRIYADDPAVPSRRRSPVVMQVPKASLSTMAECWFTSDLSTFTVKGFKWDRIEKVFAPPESGSKVPPSVFYPEILEAMFCHARRHWNSTVLSLFKERLNSCMELFSNKPTGTWNLILDEWVSLWAGGSADPGSAGEFNLVPFPSLTEALDGSSMYGHRLSMTEKGFICRSSDAISEGDFVCILLGSKVPFLLRRVDDRYELIGEVFCQGIMHGEAMGGMQREYCELQDFVLQ